MVRSNDNKKVDISQEKGNEIYFMGISSGVGVAVISSLLNRYLELELRYYNKLSDVNSNILFDSLSIFSNFEAKEDELKLDSTPDIFDLRIPEKTEYSKFILIQCKGQKAKFFPKIPQIDFLLVSNYPFHSEFSAIKLIPEVSLLFPLEKKNIGDKFKYIYKLFYS